jgi:hypothetical protein
MWSIAPMEVVGHECETIPRSHRKVMTAGFWIVALADSELEDVPQGAADHDRPLHTAFPISDRVFLAALRGHVAQGPRPFGREQFEKVLFGVEPQPTTIGQIRFFAPRKFSIF